MRDTERERLYNITLQSGLSSQRRLENTERPLSEPDRPVLTDLAIEPDRSIERKNE